mmetsp:Transcript_33336/g.78678  ORF Transcript_33336/g.78678 Transcript_33336/m.78678 type:complete len:346 (-) Transcript_33336:285-1322(-)
MSSSESAVPPNPDDTITQTNGTTDIEKEGEKLGSVQETDTTGNCSVDAAPESDTNATENQSDNSQNLGGGFHASNKCIEVETTAGEMNSNNSETAERDSMNMDDDDQVESKGISEAVSANKMDETSTEFIDKRIAKQFRVLTTNRRHQGRSSKVNRIFFGTVEKLIPGDAELWKILYDDGDVDAMSRPKLLEAIAYYEVNKSLDTNHSHQKRTLFLQSSKGKEVEKDHVEHVRSNRRRGSTRTRAIPPVKTKTPKVSKPKFARPEPVPVWEGIPDEDIDGGWPEGWVKRLYARKTGATKGATDRYWYSPKEKIRLRSMVQVKKFMRALEDTKGDESKAKEIMAKY